jgi:hypothetical protein
LDTVVIFVKNVSTFAVQKYFKGMNIRKYFHNILSIGLVLAVLMSLNSCLGGSTSEVEYIISTDAQLTAFALAHDSVPALAKAKFSIDQVNDSIYNYEPLPYLTDTAKIHSRVKVSYSTGSGLAVKIKLTYESGDTIWVASGDSMTLAPNLSLMLYAPDEKTTKSYHLNVRIHPIDPDSVQYQPVIFSGFTIPDTGENTLLKFKDAYYVFVKQPLSPSTGIQDVITCYSSQDMENWTVQPLSGLPDNTVIRGIRAGKEGLFAHTETGELYVAKNDASVWHREDVPHVVSILGYLEPGAIQKEGLALIVDRQDGKGPVFAFIQELFSAKTFLDGQPVPVDFPLAGFSVINKQTIFSSTLTLVANLQSVWTTENGIYWTQLSGTTEPLPRIEGGTAFLYNGETWFTGGKMAGDAYNREVYYSLNDGLVWKVKPAKTQAPETCIARQDASVVVDRDGMYFYIVGGRNGQVNTPVLSDCWKAALNSKVSGY